MKLTATRRLAGIVLLVVLAMWLFLPPAITASAGVTDGQLNFDKTNVLDDLQSSKTLDGKAFDVTDYPYSETRKLEVINFAEYGYSFLENKRVNFGMYLYLYNPQGVNIDVNSPLNKVQLGDKYGPGGNINSSPIDYNKYELIFCSRSTGAFMNLFYKFKIKDRVGSDKLKIVQRVNPNTRRYDISGIELLKAGNPNATDNFISRGKEDKVGFGITAKFIGFAAGYGPDPDAESTLSCDFAELESIELDVQSTFFRTNISRDKYTSGQMNSVYFGVPQSYFDSYGGLQRIKAEWYEYMTRPIVVTKNRSFYDKAMSVIGTNQSAGSSGLVLDYKWMMADRDYCAWQYNMSDYFRVYKPMEYSLLSMPDSRLLHEYNKEWSGDPALYYLFYRPDIAYTDAHSDITAPGGVSSADLAKWIYEYSASFKRGELPVKNGALPDYKPPDDMPKKGITGKISADLFYDHIMPERLSERADGGVDNGGGGGKIQRGYSVFDFDVNIDLFQLLSYNDRDKTFWELQRDLGYWKAVFGGRNEDKYNDFYKDIVPIYIVTDDDMALNDAELERKLLIRWADIGNFRDYYKKKTDAGEKVVLFRFADTEYFSAMVDIASEPNGISYVDRVKNEAYVAVETVFFDFDIIHLTFNKDGVYRVIPVVSSPIDIIPDITTPLQQEDDDGCGKGFWLAVGILLIVLVLVLLWPVLSPALKVVGGIIAIPFKAIAGLFKKRGKKNGKKTK